MKLTVAICTWNRAKLLHRALNSFTTQRNLQGATWELLVVNNNCTDETDTVISGFNSLLPIRVLHEHRPGLSHARNAAIAAAAGDYIVWTDDDVVVCAKWLSAYTTAFQNWPDHVVFGGPIRPEFEGRPPKWLLSVWSDVQHAYAIRDVSRAEGEHLIVGGKLPFGANFAIRSDVQRLHPYDANLGKNPSHPSLVGEETKVINSILNDGHPGRWVPDAVVDHWVPRSRQSTHYIRNYWKGHGMVSAMAEDFSGHSCLFGIPRWMIRARFEYEFRYLVGRVFRKPNTWIGDLTRAGFAEGQITYIRSNPRDDV